MSGQHTPGPWEVYAHPINGPGDAILELVEQVAQTSPVGDHLYLINANGKCPALTGCGPTSEANARLIAAAPELLEALECLTDAVARRVNVSLAMQMAVDARAKALGIERQWSPDRGYFAEVRGDA